MRLLIHTGGTIGMVPGPDGLRPGAGVVEAAVGRQARVVAFDPLLDSAELSFRHWNRLLDLIEAEGMPALRAEPIVVTHGTDTMAYTGAALSQALAGWPGSLVLTGSMHPLGMGGDAEANLTLALTARPGPGVWLAFAGKLLPAAGLVKTQSQKEDAFRAALPVPRSGEPDPGRIPRFRDRRLAVLTVSPGLPAATLAATLETLDGAVLRVFGAGTIPSGLEQTLALAVTRGCRLRAVSACENGGLAPGAYAAGAALWRAGVQNGGAETPEAALIRLWLSLSR